MKSDREGEPPPLVPIKLLQGPVEILRAGERLAFDVDSMKLGYLDDPVLVVYTSDGQFVASADDLEEEVGVSVVEREESELVD